MSKITYCCEKPNVESFPIVHGTCVMIMLVCHNCKKQTLHLNKQKGKNPDVKDFEVCKKKVIEIKKQLDNPKKKEINKVIVHNEDGTQKVQRMESEFLAGQSFNCMYCNKEIKIEIHKTKDDIGFLLKHVYSFKVLDENHLEVICSGCNQLNCLELNQPGGKILYDSYKALNKDDQEGIN